MSKFMKFWTLIICLFFIFLIIFTDRVNAESCNIFNNYNFNELTNISYNATNGKYSYNKTLTNAVSVPSNYQNSLLKGKLWLSVYDNSNTAYSNIDWNLTCNNTQRTSVTESNSYTITYADGTHATIQGNITDYENFCANYNLYTGLTIQYNYKPVSNIINMRLTTNNGLIPCIVDSGGSFTCYLNNTSSITGVWVDLITSYSTNNGVNVRFGWTDYAPLMCVDNAQQIINNNNTNTQTIHNDNQQQYNFISNTTIDTTTTDNVNNIDVSNSDTKLAVTNFVLIPLNFMQSIINSFSSSCSQVCIGNCGSGHDNDWRFVFPCLDFESILGSNLYAIIDSLFAFGMVFAFIRSVRKFFINALLLTTDSSSEVDVFL